jgi:MoxR-like ATPase
MSSVAFEVARRLQENMDRVVLGKPEVVKNLLVALLAGDHVLLEDVPGVGKTLAAKALAKSIEGKFTRIQFTPDLLPSDIVGSSLYRADQQEFEFSPGPVFANVVLADEINRAPPRTQSALLEAMSDFQVSSDGITHPLPRPFIVIATQNPFEFEGTYPLPESQLDRFLIRVTVGYPSREIERDVLSTHRAGEPVEHLKHVVTSEEIVAAQLAVRDVRVEPMVVEYLLDLVHATRDSERLLVGVSTRGALGFYRACQARAAVEGRDFVTPDDAQALAVPVFAHRVVLRGVLQGADRKTVEQEVESIVNRIVVPA